MKAKIIIAASVVVASVCATAQWVTVTLQSTNQLAARRPITGETVIVLNTNGTSIPGPADAWYNTTNTTVPEGENNIPAIDGSAWVRAERPEGSGFNGTLTCLDDNTVHTLGLTLVGTNYLLSINQVAADPLLFPTSFAITADDLTTHLILIAKIGTNYTIEITQ